MKCRHCKSQLEHVFVDLGVTPPSNAYISHGSLTSDEATFPLRVMVCDACWLVQTEDYASAETFFADEYAYFSSYSISWLEHSKKYVQAMANRFDLNAESVVVEVAANDGYLLQYVRELGISCYGIEPTASTADAAREKGIDIVAEFFGHELADKLARSDKRADLMIANNVLAHVPDINDFTMGFSTLLKPSGVSTFEFPHLCELVDKSQFDTIYHEHFSYLSLTSVQTIFRKNGLQIFDVEKLSTHGGSLRVYAQRRDVGVRSIEPSVKAILAEELRLGIQNLKYYQAFDNKVQLIKDRFLEFLEQACEDNKRVVGYGAAAKGNTLLNYAGVNSDLISYVVDRNPEKQGKYLPGSRIPIFSEQHLENNRPDYIVIFPWNLANEIYQQLEYAKKWGARFVTTIPTLLIRD